MSTCCRFFQVPGKLICISAFTCVVRQAIGVPGVLCGCCELVRRRIVGVR